jgi:hypothetical protein
MNLYPALAFLAECTASQPRQGELQGVYLFDRMLNPPSTVLADFPIELELPWRGKWSVEMTFRER